MTKKLYIKTFGCQMNEYDTERIISAFELMGYETTDEPSEADFAIINTCSVREKPSEKVKSEIGRLKKYKKENPNFKIGVAGCVAQQEGEAILNSNNYVDMVLGTDGIPRIGEVIEKVENGERLAVTDFSSDSFTIPNFSRNRSVSAFVTIMKGCDNFCSYCIVPYVRGREKSRRPGEILDEVKYLVDNGVKEVTFLGQNVNSYGKNLDENINFTQFLYMATKIDGLKRIRFVTSHPKDFSSDLVDLIASEEKICEYLHLPLQAGSDNILKKMNRGYSYPEYFEKVSMAKEKIKNLAVSSDFIVGFPEEKDEDFLKTIHAINEIEYETIFAFKYSPRPGTKVANLKDDISEIIKSQRLKELLDEQEKITSKLLKSQIGEVQEVMIEGVSKKDNNAFSGRNRRNRIVNLVCSEILKPGDIVNVKILQAKKNSLYGEKI